MDATTHRPAIECDDHDAAAVLELWWVEDPGGPDERGQTTPLCASTTCLSRAEAAVLALGGSLLDLASI